VDGGRARDDARGGELRGTGGDGVRPAADEAEVGRVHARERDVVGKLGRERLGGRADDQRRSRSRRLHQPAAVVHGANRVFVAPHPGQGRPHPLAERVPEVAVGPQAELEQPSAERSPRAEEGELGLVVVLEHAVGVGLGVAEPRGAVEARERLREGGVALEPAGPSRGGGEEPREHARAKRALAREGQEQARRVRQGGGRHLPGRVRERDLCVSPALDANRAALRQVAAARAERSRELGECPGRRAFAAGVRHPGGEASRRRLQRVGRFGREQQGGGGLRV